MNKVHGSTCGKCVSFPECSKPQVKYVSPDSRICHWNPGRFVRKETP